MKNRKKINMKKNGKRTGALVLAVLTASMFCMPVQAADTQAASTTEKNKEEVIYINTTAGGSPESVYAVNISPGGTIQDHGNYSAVKMLTTDDAISLTGDTVSFTTNAEKVYYQGDMINTRIPWNISIRYYIDGVEYSAQDVAGKSGHLEIKYNVTQNQSDTSGFYDNYALESNFTLDADKCSNITADGATIANVGSNKQISYIILPGQGIDTTISADVTDFEMESAAINGVKLNMNLDIDEDSLKAQIDELLDAQAQVSDGAFEVADATETLKSGSSTLNDGAGSVSSGSDELNQGVQQLQSGIQTAQNGLDQIAANSGTLRDSSSQVYTALQTIQGALDSVSVSTDSLTTLTTSSSQIRSGIDTLNTGMSQLQAAIGSAGYKQTMSDNGLDVDSLQEQNNTAVSTLTTQIQELGQQYQAALQAGDETTAAQLKAQIDSLTDTVKLIGANNAAVSGAESYMDGVSDQAQTVTDGLSSLDTQYAQFDDGVQSLPGTINGLLGQLDTLKSAISTLTTSYGELNSGIDSYTQGVDTLASGYTEITKGVSTLASGSASLAQGSGSLYSGTQSLYSGVSQLCDGAGTLASGTLTLKDQTNTSVNDAEGQVENILDSLSGDSETVSFVSDKNQDVKSVQFVIKTAKVEKAEQPAAQETQQTQMSFWDKLVALFKH
ncbi:MAG: hypothetical protein ACOYB8_11045 [Eubacteriaceae bacterium]|jgi:putative membrane protein